MAATTVLTDPIAAVHLTSALDHRGSEAISLKSFQPTHRGRAEDENEDGAALEGMVTSEHAENPNRPKGVKFALLIFSLVLGDFFVGYDTSCVATLTTVISNEFQVLNTVGWYGTAYLLASCATILIFGQLYSFYPMKSVLQVSFILFAIGSAISATAPSSPVFIVGRAVSGLASAGVFSGSNIIIAHTVPLKKRPIFQALSGGVECIALALGPTISGGIASSSNWRVSFYIMIPVCVLCSAVVYFFVHDLELPENAGLANKEKIRRLDLTGFTVYVPAMACLILGFQWAGTEYAWSNWRIILLMALSATLVGLFLFLERRAGKNSMLPLETLRQRTVALSSVYTFCNSAALCVVAYYLPIYFQAVRGQTPLGAGFKYIPTAISFAASVFIAGPATSMIGYYNPILIFGTVLMLIGSGLMTTFTTQTPAVKWIAYQVIRGIGCGLAFQQPYTAVQTILPEARVPMGLVSLSFTQEIGGIVALSVSQNVFVNRLKHRIASDVPDLDISKALNNGVLGVIEAAPAQVRDKVLGAYNAALMDVFFIPLGLICAAMAISLCMQWRSVKNKKTE